MADCNEDAMGADKLLSVSVAAYNMEDYLAETLESCVVSDSEGLEVIVVDDGSTDRTAQIANQYVQRYPDVFRLVSKENGGYGTTVNVGLAHARGKYFRLLDADDWFDKNGLQQLLDDLRELDVDLAITPLVEVYESEERILDQAAPDVAGLCPFEEGIVVRELNMHSSTYRTELLRRIGLRLPPRRLYTDLIFVSTPLAQVRSVYVSHQPLYRYRLSRADQSVAIDSQVRHRDDKERLVDDLIGLYEQAARSAPARTTIGFWVSGTCGFHLRMLYGMEPSEQTKAEIADFVNGVKGHPEAYEFCLKNSRWFKLLVGAGHLPYRLTSWAVRTFARLG